MATLQRIDQLEGNLSRAHIQQIRDLIIKSGGTLDDYQFELEKATQQQR